MPRFRYRAMQADGSMTTGHVDAAHADAATQSLRRAGVRPVEIAPDEPASGAASRPRTSAAARAAARTLIAELAVLLRAGLPLDRAMGLAITNIPDTAQQAPFAELLLAVREGTPLSRAMATRPDLFTPVAIAMTEAGEANGKLAPALSRLSDMLEASEDLRRLIGTSMIYPIALCIIAVGVVALMLLFVVPQFESLFASAADRLPPASRAVMGASRFVRDHGLLLLLGLFAMGLGGRAALRAPGTRARVDAAMLHVPQLGDLIRFIETARFARTLGVLIEGEVALPAAVTLAQRTIANGSIGGAVERVANGIREGGGLTTPLAAAGVFPKIAIGFLRTGEETSQLGPMLHRLADVLDRDVKVRLQRMIGIATPVITVVLGVSVAAIIAAIMSAIIGFNDLAVTS